MHPDSELATALRHAMTTPAPRVERARRAAEAIQAAGPFHWVGLYDVTPSVITAIAWTGPTPPAYPTFPRTRGLNGAAVTTAETVIANDVAADPRYLTTFAATGAEMIVPVLDTNGLVVGTIDVESPTAGVFGPAQQALVAACADVLRPLWAHTGETRTPLT